MSPRHISTVAGVFVMALFAAAPVHAATTAWAGFESRQCTDAICNLPDATFLATGGPENNTMTIHVDFSGVTVSDPAGVSPGPNCTAINLTAARCEITARHLALRLTGNGGSDTIDATADRPVEPVFDGGDGDDTLRGTEGPDVLRGGTGRDSLFGRGSPRGPDVFEGGPGADLLDGGSGEDEVRYTGSTRPVNVDLARGSGNGQAGENDTTVRIDDVKDVPQGSTLAGDAGPNRLELPSAAGTLNGRGGSDVLFGGTSAVGGDGDDIFYDVSDSVVCDGGRDEVNGIARRISLSCDEVYDAAFEQINLREPHRLGSAFAFTELACDPLSTAAPTRRRRTCPASLTASTGGRRVTGGPTKLRLGRTRVVAARLDKRGQRLLKRRGALEVRLSYSLKSPGKKTVRGSFLTTLRKP